MQNTEWKDGSRIRYYGESGNLVLLLHGGPAAYGDLHDLAPGLQDSFRVIEPWQRASGEIPLSVKVHVDDLHELINWKSPDKPPALIGHSWGAMLALIYASEYPDEAGAIALVGCGTFTSESQLKMKQIMVERMSDDDRLKIKQIEESIEDYEERMIGKYKIIGKLQEYEHIPHQTQDDGSFDKQGHLETWNDMVRLRDIGTYPAAFASIKSPVIMLHGAYDPHPGRMIYESLKPYIPQLEYKEWEKCGHYPWREKFVKDEFYKFLRIWLEKNS